MFDFGKVEIEFFVMFSKGFVLYEGIFLEEKCLVCDVKGYSKGRCWIVIGYLLWYFKLK